MAKIFIPTPLRKFTGGEPSVEVEATTVSDAIESLAGIFPDLRQHLYDANDQIRRFLRIYVGEEDIQQLQGPETPLQAGDNISIIPAIAGGKI
jgi:molybdopterin converting factor small subunit